MKKIIFSIFALSAVLFPDAKVAAKEVLQGYLTGNMCGAYSMICPLDHRDSKQEHIVFMTHDGKKVYEVKGAGRKKLYSHFTHLVQIEGNVTGNVIEVKKITHLNAGEAGKIIGKDKMKHQGHGHKH